MTATQPLENNPEYRENLIRPGADLNGMMWAILLVVPALLLFLGLSRLEANTPVDVADDAPQALHLQEQH